MGLAAFDSLRAEDEPWLEHCYIPPPDFSLMAGWRSALVFGGPGSGKTALRLALERTWCPVGHVPPLLLVRWPMALTSAPGLTGTRLVQEQVNQVYDVVARQLLLHVGRFPSRWEACPGWARTTATWFVQRKLRGHLSHLVDSLEDQLSAPGLALLRRLSSATVADVLYPDSPTALLVSELVKALDQMKLEGVRVVVDNVEPWLSADSEALASQLEAFLSALALFEHPRFAYMLFLPAQLQSPLWSAGSAVRRRVDVYAMRWAGALLRGMVERRLALALDEPCFELGRLGPAKTLLNWLRFGGGQVPRGWLEMTRPFVGAYFETSDSQGQRERLSTKQCLTLQRRHPPHLYMDLASGQVTIGWREVPPLHSGPQGLLRYLYLHRGQVCCHEDIWRAYLEATDRKMPEDTFRKQYAGALDNAVYRVRQAIEPDPKHPVFVVTVKGMGFRLDNAW